MNEITIDENKYEEKKQILPEIKSNQNIPKINENSNQKNEINNSKLLQLPKENEPHNSENLLETDSSKRKNELNLNEKIEINEHKDKSPKNNKVMDNPNSLDNKLYFTETNIQSNGNKNTTEKSNSSKLHTIEVIPEIPQKTNKSTRALSSKSSSKTREIKINDRSKFKITAPEIQLQKRVINKYNFLPLQHKIKEIEEQMKKQNEYDFQKSMKELKIKYEQKIKEKQRKKLINAKNERFKNKLKQMEEFRNNMINEKWIKLMNKQNRLKKRNKRKNNSFVYSTYDKTEKNNGIIKSQSTIDINNSEKEDSFFPSIQNMSRLEYIKLRKEKNENEFCNQALQKIQENEENHRRNYLNHLNNINSKILQHERLYRQRSYNCLRKIQKKDDEIKENFIKREMIKRYNINKMIVKAKYNRKLKIDKSNQVKYNVKENQELLEKKFEEKVLNYQKKLEQQNNFKNKKNLKLKTYNTEKMQKQINFRNLQQENMENLNDQMKRYYRSLILRHEDNVSIINAIIKSQENTMDKVVKRTIDEQIKKTKEIENLYKFKDKIQNENIYNLRDEQVKKIFDRKRIDDRKKLEEEQDFFNYK